MIRIMKHSFFQQLFYECYIKAVHLHHEKQAMGITLINNMSEGCSKCFKPLYASV